MCFCLYQYPVMHLAQSVLSRYMAPSVGTWVDTVSCESLGSLVLSRWRLDRSWDMKFLVHMLDRKLLSFVDLVSTFSLRAFISSMVD